MKMHTYLEQYNRAKRWYKRFKEIYDGVSIDLPSDYYQDIVYSFFQNCYHLKDWLVNSRIISSNKVENFIDQSLEMRICADICNGSKHLTLKSSRTGKQDTGIKRKHYKLDLYERKMEIHYEVTSGKDVYDAFDLSTRCLEQWECFLKHENLI